MRSQLPFLPASSSRAALAALALLALTGCPTISKSDLASRIDDDGDGFTSAQFGGDDCDDADETVHPDATEAPYDGVDGDCSGGSDNDADGDGYDAAVIDGAPAAGDDCNDADAAVNPGAAEICDGVDNDCDGAIGDVGSPSTDESDNDGDGFFVCANDCDDTDPAVNPGATELCDADNTDEDCDGSTDDGDSSASGQADWYLDDDHDGYGTPDTLSSRCDQPTDYVSNADDCDDTNGGLNPDTLWYADADEDAWGDDLDWLAQCTQPDGFVVDPGDCLDSDPDVHPGASESCNEIDDDCDALVDADDPDVDPAEALWYRDRDLDGYGDSTSTLTACTVGTGYVHTPADCDDYTAVVNPGAPEVCDTQDNDCDGYVDDADPDVTDMTTWYADVDGDEFGDATDSRIGCFQPPSYVADDTDCEDGDVAVNPDAQELCDTIDNDCDADVDDADSSVAPGTTTYTDADGDGFGDSATATTACAPAATNVTVPGDCDDGEATVNPDESEVCDDSLDNDCDGVTDTAYFACATADADYTTTWGSEMIAIAPGTFTMGGGTADSSGNYTDHEVTLTHDFWVAQTELTQAQWAAWTGAANTTPSYFSTCGSDCPVEQVSWYDSAQYANALSAAEGLTPCYLTDGTDLAAAYLADPYSCPGYRLPTEAEWEYAARAGEDTSYSGSNTIGDVAWYGTNSGSTTHGICGLDPNAWGLCDMSGNVFEWTNDWYSSSYGGYGTGVAGNDPGGPSSGSYRVFRGGGWNYDGVQVSASYRYAGTPSATSYGRSGNLGFRLARSVP